VLGARQGLARRLVARRTQWRDQGHDLVVLLAVAEVKAVDAIEARTDTPDDRIGATAPLVAVLRDASAQVRRTLADGAMVRVVADRAAVTHRVRVLPGLEQRLELRS
jgi:hypothetical protein